MLDHALDDVVLSTRTSMQYTYVDSKEGEYSS